MKGFLFSFKGFEVYFCFDKVLQVIWNERKTELLPWRMAMLSRFFGWVRTAAGGLSEVVKSQSKDVMLKEETSV